MDSKIFTLGLRTISAVMPYAKKLQDDEAQFLWLTLDQRIKDNISNEMWTYAVKHYMELSHHDETLPVHMDVLSLFIKKQNGSPCLEWGFTCNSQEFLQGLQASPAQPLLAAEKIAKEREDRQFRGRLAPHYEEPTEDSLGLRSLPSA
jgi:hypothetical protein